MGNLHPVRLRIAKIPHRLAVGFSAVVLRARAVRHEARECREPQNHDDVRQSQQTSDSKWIESVIYHPNIVDAEEVSYGADRLDATQRPTLVRPGKQPPSRYASRATDTSVLPEHDVRVVQGKRKRQLAAAAVATMRRRGVGTAR